MERLVLERAARELSCSARRDHIAHEGLEVGTPLVVVQIVAHHADHGGRSPLGAERHIVSRALARLLVVGAWYGYVLRRTAKQHECHGRCQENPARKHTTHGGASILGASKACKRRSERHDRFLHGRS